MKRNRWLIALAAAGIHICIGSVYAWSVLHEACYGGNGIISFGNYVGVFYCHFISWAFRRISWRYCGASWPAQVGTGFCLFLRLRHGGDGICRLCKVGGAFVPVLRMYRGDRTGNRVYHPVSTLVKWFPLHRGFATGLAIMGFGFAALIAGPAMQYLTVTVGLAENFLILAAVYAAVMALSASYLRAPRPGEVVPCLEDVLKAEMEKGKKRTVLGPQLTRKEAMRTWKWYALWWIFFTNITCGIGLLAVVSPMAQDVIGMAPPEAASFVGIIGVVNGGGVFSGLLFLTGSAAV